MQAMDRPSIWIAAGRPFLLNGREPPRNGELVSTGQDVVS
jgi:hypothetical protein